MPGSHWVWTVVGVLLAVWLVLLIAAKVDAQDTRATAMLSAGPVEVTAHAANTWHQPDRNANVYLGDAGDPALAGVAPPDGPILLTERCTLADVTYTAIQRLDPAGIIGLGRVCPQVVDEAAMTPQQRADHREQAPCAGRADVCAGLDRIAGCESGRNPTAHNPTGRYHGAWQWDLATWHSQGETGDPHSVSYAYQRDAAYRLWLRRGTQPWPQCGARF